MTILSPEELFLEEDEERRRRRREAEQRRRLQEQAIAEEERQRRAQGENGQVPEPPLEEPLVEEEPLEPEGSPELPTGEAYDALSPEERLP